MSWLSPLLKEQSKPTPPKAKRIPLEARLRGQKQPIQVGGVSYPSMRAAAKALGHRGRSQVYRMMGEGWRLG